MHTAAQQVRRCFSLEVYGLQNLAEVLYYCLNVNGSSPRLKPQILSRGHLLRTFGIQGGERSGHFGISERERSVVSGVNSNV